MDLADRAAAGHQVGWENLRQLMNRGWLENAPGFMASVTEVPAPAFNGVTVYGEFSAAELSAALDRVAASGFPYSLQARPAVTAAAAAVAAARGMTAEAGMPLMAITAPPVIPATTGLAVRKLTRDEGGIHASVVAEAFGAPVEVLRALATPEIMGAAGAHVLAGDCDGITVATSIADVNGATTGVYNVGTRAAYRGRGFGAAMTAAAVHAGFADGSELAFLLSSPMGEGVYERLGFQRLEHWSLWVAAADG